MDQLTSERFADQSPYQVYSRLLDEGSYLCSPRTMYRILSANQSVRERRDQLSHPAYRKPELLATGPNQVWSWDITKLKGPEKWTYYYLYVIIDIYSRCTVGWMLAHNECSELAQKLIQETIDKQAMDEEQVKQLTIHSDRGAAMKSHNVANLLTSLGVRKSHSRPHVSNDNPFSESQFKTLKYHADFPDRFGSYQDALAHSRKFFDWYNNEHYHSGIGFVTPSSLHYGRASQVIIERQATLNQAYLANPQRFVKGTPQPKKLPTAVWINPPATEPEDKKRTPEIHCSGVQQVASLTHPRSDYPSASCVPAELASVSSDLNNLQQNNTLNTRAMPEKILGVRGQAPDQHPSIH